MWTLLVIDLKDLLFKLKQLWLLLIFLMMLKSFKYDTNFSVNFFPFHSLLLFHLLSFTFFPVHSLLLLLFLFLPSILSNSVFLFLLFYLSFFFPLFYFFSVTEWVIGNYSIKWYPSSSSISYSQLWRLCIVFCCTINL